MRHDCLSAIMLFCCSAAVGGEIEFVKTMHDTIPLYGTQADVQHAAFDAALADETVVVADGATLVLACRETALDVLVRGTLKLQDGASLACRTLTVVGATSRLELHGQCTLSFRDLPIDTTLDPDQYGHGLLVIHGSLVAESADWRQSWATLAEEAHAGDTKLRLTGEARGWRAGDRLVLPDTRQPESGADLSAQTEIVTISNSHLGELTLTAPVQYDHLGWRKQDATVGLLPDIGCLTQPIVIQSETPSGVRGHVFITATADQDVQGVSVVEMGRTRAADVLNSTTRDDQLNIKRIGTNQIGRYAWHHHHLLGRRDNGKPCQFRLEHCSVDGSPKWGIAVHGSHFGLVNDCCVYNAAGSGIVTEDPWVYGNEITNNIVIAKQPGSHLRITNDHDGRSKRVDPTGDFWHDRGGLGLTSAMNEITGNRLYCCKESIGMAGAFGGGIVLYKPKAPGLCPTCNKANRITLGSHMGYGDDPKRYPFVFDTSGNLAWGGWRGIETWNADSHPGFEQYFPGLTIVNCRKPVEIFDHRETVFNGWKVLGDFSQLHGHAIDFKDDYRFGITANDCELRGYEAAYRLVMDSEYTNWNRCTFECPLINDLPRGRISFNGAAWSGEWNGCTFLPVNGVVKFIDGWYPKYDLTLWQTKNRENRKSLAPISYHIRPWRDGRDLDVYHYEQHPTWVKPPIAAPDFYGDWPPGVYSQAQLVGLNTPIFGAAVPDTAFQSAEFGVFWANQVSPPEPPNVDQLEATRQENLQLQQELKGFKQ